LVHSVQVAAMTIFQSAQPCAPLGHRLIHSVIVELRNVDFYVVDFSSLFVVIRPERHVVVHVFIKCIIIHRTSLIKFVCVLFSRVRSRK